VNSRTIRKSPASQQGGHATVAATALASGAATLIVALVVGWLTVGRDAVGRDEVIELIATSAPYAREREALHNSVTTNTQRIDDITGRLREIERQGHRVEAKLDLLLSEFSQRETPVTEDE